MDSFATTLPEMDRFGRTQSEFNEDGEQMIQPEFVVNEEKIKERIRNPPHRIVVGYDDKYGQGYNGNIRDEDVVRPPNHKWTKTNNDWKLKTTARCPTYGSCEYCFRSGPVGKRCIDYGHGDIQATYKVAVMDGYIMDSITLAEIAEKGHEQARADRMYQWLKTPTMRLSHDMLMILSKRGHTDDQASIIRGNIYNFIDMPGHGH
jgi:hypothetical protein